MEFGYSFLRVWEGSCEYGCEFGNVLASMNLLLASMEKSCEYGIKFARTSIAVQNYAKQGCNDTCGNVTIPYPFGIGASCSINKWYIIDCNSSIPYLSQLDHLEVLDVNLEDQIVTVNMQKFSDCRCGNALMMDDNGSVLTGCSTTCLNDTVSDTNYKCVGISCCQTTIPHYLTSYSMNLTGLVSQMGNDRACESAAFLVYKNSYGEGKLSDNNSFSPISLLWTLSDLDIERRKVDMDNGTLVDTWKCSISSSFQGNPYLANGCVEVPDARECASCKSRGGYCSYNTIYDVDGLVYKERNFICGSSYYVGYERKSQLGVILGNVYTMYG
ncbi:wall-associated receptor kinase [Artemisia annua]|uniref:Wall-associated receptor kinase n=1 Tax=Artemisia annua TaxID=35608 RepID=A0A2U1NS26_ARTAN|nr:wall-associated receptor kinase [Artemisia annua]